MEDGGNGFTDESIDVFVGGLTAARIEFLEQAVLDHVLATAPKDDPDAIIAAAINIAAMVIP